MDVPADRSRPTSALSVHPSLREAVRSPRRRRPTGAAPPLPYRLQSSGIGWLVAAVVLVGLTVAVFARGLRGPAALAAHDRVAGRRPARELPHLRPGGDRSPAAPVRGGAAVELGWLGDAVGAGRL